MQSEKITSTFVDWRLAWSWSGLMAIENLSRFSTLVFSLYTAWWHQVKFTSNNCTLRFLKGISQLHYLRGLALFDRKYGAPGRLDYHNGWYGLFETVHDFCLVFFFVRRFGEW